MSGTMAQPTSTALLEELRQRIRSEYAPPPMTDADRLAAFGRGVLSNRGSFLENLTAGVTAQEQAAAARAEQQRRALDMERQTVENAIREETERNRLAQSASQFEAEGPTREARIRAYNAQAAQAGRPDPGTIVGTQEGTGYAIRLNRDGTTTVLTGVFPTQALRNTPRPLSQAQIANIRQQVTRLASADAGIIEGVAPTPAQITRRDELADRYFRDRLDAAAAGLLEIQGGGAGTGSANTTTDGRPAPSQTLQYSGPAAPAAPRTGPRISAQPPQQAPQ
jgi:hypothetical protein